MKTTVNLGFGEVGQDRLVWMYPTKMPCLKHLQTTSDVSIAYVLHLKTFLHGALLATVEE